MGIDKYMLQMDDQFLSVASEHVIPFSDPDANVPNGSVQDGGHPDVQLNSQVQDWPVDQVVHRPVA